MLKVIIAEDERIIRKNLEKYINENVEGFTVEFTFADGRETVEYIKNHKVDIVITDIRMHEISGLEIARYIYENSLNIAVIIISAYKDFSYAQKSIEYSVCSYLSKPITPENLKKALQKAKLCLNGTEPQSYENICVKTVSESDDRESALMKKALEFVKNNFNKDISLVDVANHVYLSEHYFGGIFRKNIPEGFTHYLLRLRMEEAIRLLKTRRYTVTEISSMVGYNNSAYFIKVFKKYTNVTPKQYFRMINKDEK